MARLIILLALGIALLALLIRAVRGAVQRSRAAAQRRDLERRAHAQERDARELPGARSDRPIEVETPAVIEPQAAAESCRRCGGRLRLLSHTSETRAGQRLRVARMKCARCGDERDIFFRLPAVEIH